LTKVPLAPLVNSFQPERKGQIGGVLTASAQIKGAGITGASLQKNLSGQAQFVVTNLNLAIENTRSKHLRPLVDAIVGIPDLIRNPGEKVVGLAQGALGTVLGTPRASRSGYSEEVMRAPINAIVLRASADNGRVELQQTRVLSSAFEADARGDITLAPVLTNSTLKIPVSIALQRSLADKIGLVPANTPTNVAYLPLPDFYTEVGTIGDPKPHIDPVALVAFAAKAGLGVAKQIGGAAGGKGESILNAVEGLGGLSGGKTAPAGTQTNQPPAEQNPPFNPLDLLRGLKK
jgi:hypothetical protein